MCGCKWIAERLFFLYLGCQKVRSGAFPAQDFLPPRCRQAACFFSNAGPVPVEPQSEFARPGPGRTRCYFANHLHEKSVYRVQGLHFLLKEDPLTFRQMPGTSPFGFSRPLGPKETGALPSRWLSIPHLPTAFLRPPFPESVFDQSALLPMARIFRPNEHPLLCRVPSPLLSPQRCPYVVHSFFPVRNPLLRSAELGRSYPLFGVRVFLRLIPGEATHVHYGTVLQNGCPTFLCYGKWKFYVPFFGAPSSFVLSPSLIGHLKTWLLEHQRSLIEVWPI